MAIVRLGKADVVSGFQGSPHNSASIGGGGGWTATATPSARVPATVAPRPANVHTRAGDRRRARAASRPPRNRPINAETALGLANGDWAQALKSLSATRTGSPASTSHNAQAAK